MKEKTITGKYFDIPLDEALHLACEQMALVLRETENYNGSQHLFWRHQVLETAKVVDFLLVLVTAQQQEMNNLRTRIEKLEE